MSNICLLISARQKSVFDHNYVHTIRSNQTLAIEISKTTSVKSNSKYASTALDIDNYGEFLLSGDAVGAISIHQINQIVENSKNEVNVLCSEQKNGHKFCVNSVKWFPNDTGIFVTGSSDKTLKVWDTNEMVSVDSFKFSGHVNDTGLSDRPGKTSHLIAAAISNHQIKLCDIKSGSDTHTLKGHVGPVTSVTWSNRNPHALFSGGKDGKIVMWDIRRSNAALHYFDKFNGTSQIAHSGSVTSLSQTEGGLFLLSSGQDQQVRCWNLSNGENTLKNYGNVGSSDVKPIKSSISFNSCYPGLLYLPNGSNISIFDILTGQHIHDLSGHFGRVNAVYFNKIKPQLISSSSDCTILVWDPPGPEERDEHIGKPNPYQDSWSDSDDD